VTSAPVAAGASVRRGRRGGQSARARKRPGARLEFQRQRLLRAALAVACEHGYEGMSATAVAARAGASRKTFYDVFDDREDCFLAILEDCLAEIAAAVAPVYEAQGEWSERLRAGLAALLAYLDGERDTGTLVLSYLVQCGPRSLDLRARVLEHLHSVVEDGLTDAKPRYESSPLAGEFVVGGVLAVIYAHLRTSRRPLIALLNQLTWMVVLPCRGPAAAGRELTRTTPAHAATLPPRAGDPLRRLDLSLTYRTARVLEVVGLAPGANNAQVGAGAGITDQGQISKLLTRLAGVGLVENTGVGQRAGGANAWHLTGAGIELVTAIGRNSL
jgi:AcrR family transcriptional regulator